MPGKGWRSSSPHWVKSGRGRGARAGRGAARLLAGVALDVFFADPSAGSAAAHLGDLDADLAGQAAHRRRSDHGFLGLRGLGGGGFDI